MTMPSARKPFAQAGRPGDSRPGLDVESLAGEVLRLRRDLWLFRTVFLPVLLRTVSPDLVERWQATARELAQALPREDGSGAAALVEEPVLRLLRTGYPEGGFLLTPPPPDPFELVG